MKVVCATGQERLDEALSQVVEVAATAHYPDAAHDAAMREQPDAVVVASGLAGEETTDLVQRLRAAGLRIVWLAGRTPGDLDRGKARALIALGVYDIVCDPVTRAALVQRLEHPATLGQALALVDGPGQRPTRAADLGAALRMPQGIALAEDTASPPRRPRRPGPTTGRPAAGGHAPSAESGDSEPATPTAAASVPDRLTGLPLRAWGESLMSGALAAGRPLHVVFVDLDGFKQVNDTQGHEAGDRVLRTAARALAGALREGDDLVRWGGDEFVAVLRTASADGAAKALWRLRQAGVAVGVGFSAGVAAARRGDTVESLLQRADEAMYRDKERRHAGILAAGLTAFLGALPGCGTSRAAIAFAREGALASGLPLLLIDAHPERAALAHYLLGRHLDPLGPEDRCRSWRHVRAMEAIRACAVEVAPNLLLLPLAYDPDPGEAPAPPDGGMDVSLRLLPQGLAADVFCRAGRSPGQVRTTLDALASGGQEVTVRAVAVGLCQRDRQVWERELGVGLDEDPPGRPAGPPGRLLVDLALALRACASVAAATVLDLGAPPPLVGGVPDPRVTWVARNAEPVIVTRADGLGEEAARRLRTVLEREAERAGRDLQVRVLAGDVAVEEGVGHDAGEVRA